jgi:hypothetical protein
MKTCPYYVLRNPKADQLYELRQTRYRGRKVEHPHDVCVVARDLLELGKMIVASDLKTALQAVEEYETAFKHEYAPDELAAMPTTHSGHFEDLKIEHPRCYRVWLARTGRADGDTEWPVRYEVFGSRGTWVKADSNGKLISLDMKSIALVGRRWWRKGPGNTMHSVVVAVDGVEVARLRGNGGERCYEDTAARWLHRNGYLARKGRNDGLYRMCDDASVKVVSEAIDVRTEKEL